MNADKLLEDLREVDLFNVDSVNYGNRKHYIDQLESVVCQQQAEIEALKSRELTDEEILKLASEYCHYTEYKQAILFARAILRKAQEK